MVVHCIKNKNAFYFPFRAAKTPDAEEFILKNGDTVLLPVGNGESPTFHNQCHLNGANVLFFNIYNCVVNILHRLIFLYFRR